MPLDLLKRGEKAAGPAGDLTAAEHDANFTAIENEVNAKASVGHTHTSAEVTGTFGNDRLADMLEGTIKGRAAGGGTGDPEDLTAEQVLEILGIDLDALSLPVVDTTELVHDPSNDTKRMRIDVGAVAGGATRVVTMGDRNVDLAAGGTFAELSHTHGLADITDAGALAGQDDITSSQISDATADGLAILTSADANSFTDAEQAKLAGISEGAAALPAADTTAIVKGSADPTKLLRFEVDGFTSGETRVITPADRNWSPTAFGEEITEVADAAGGRQKISVDDGQVSLEIPSAADGDYIITDLNTIIGTITTGTIRTSAGTCTAAWKIADSDGSNADAITNMSAVNASTTRATATASGANTMAKTGTTDRILLVTISSASGLGTVWVTTNFTRS